MNTKKLLAIGSALLLVAGFVSIGAGPANAENADNTNNTSYWENVYPGSTCYKDDAKYGAVSSDGMTVTLSGSDDWTALIVKGGAVDYGQGPGNKVYGSPVSGTPYSPPLNAGNQQAAVSHWIVCVGNPPPLIKVTPVKPEVTSHDVCGVANDSLTVDSSMTGVVYTVSWNGDHSVATVTATVSDSSKYVFAEGATTSWTYDFTNEACPPTPCLPKSAVSYTYNSTTNSGVITVTAVGGYSDTLCNPFWVTAAAWTFDGNTMWSQTLDKWVPANSGAKIDSVGTYNYGADVGCGQGDIYATFSAPGVVYPTGGVLNGPSNPYSEHFLHDMGFTGPNPTYTVRDAASCNPVAAGVAFQGYTCNEFAPLVLTGSNVTFTVKYDDANPVTSVSNVAPGSYNLVADFGAQTGAQYIGQVTVTVQPDAGFTLLSEGTPVPLTANTRIPAIVKAAPAMQTTWVLAANLPQDCPTVITVVPAATFTDACGIDGDIVNIPTTTGVTYTETDNRTDGVGMVTVVATPSSAAYVFGSSVTKTSWSFNFPDAPCPTIQPIAPTASDPTCSTDPDPQSGYIMVDLQTGLHYFINGVETTSARNDVAPGTYTVSVTVDDGLTLVGPSSWPPLTVNDAFCPPTLALLSTTASMTNISCTAAGSYTLANTEGIEWFVDGSETATPAGTYSVKDATTVNVEARLIDPVTDGWEEGAQKTWTFNFTTPVDCLPTLAFTGTDGGNLGLLLAGGFLLFGGAIIAFERRFRTNVR